MIARIAPSKNLPIALRVVRWITSCQPRVLAHFVNSLDPAGVPEDLTIQVTDRGVARFANPQALPAAHC
jgi:hypothetical protein